MRPEEVSEALRRRVQLTVSCRATDSIPKISGAGSIEKIGDIQVQLMHNGIQIVKDSYQGSWQTQIIQELQGHHEPQEEVVFNEMLNRISQTSQQPVIVELGSNWAYYSMWFMKHFPNGNAVLLEPDPNFLELGKRHFALNGLQGTFHHGVVSDGLGTHCDFETESAGVQRNLRKYSLSELLQESGQSHIDLLMCDIQGAEEILIRNEETFLHSQNIRFALISTHHHSISHNPMTHWDVLDLLTELGAHIICEHSVSESFSGDGLIAVSFDPIDSDFTMEIPIARANEEVFPRVERNLRDTQNELDRVRRKLAKKQRELEVLKSSLSWRISAPIRTILGFVIPRR